MKDPAFIDAMLERGAAATAAAESGFAGLSAVQFDWKPAANRWSIAECLDHLVVADTAYFPLLARIVAGDYVAPLWPRISPFSGLFGRLLVASVEETAQRKMSAPTVFQPTASAIGEAALTRFREHQAPLLDYIAACSKVDLDTTIIASPALAPITYSLRDAFKIVIPHQHRHIRQALRVREEAGFPA